MNCKPGDLAVIIKAEYCPKHLGKVVTVVRAFDSESWVVDPPVSGFVAVFDCALKPIRDQDGTDEMIRIAGKPKTKEREIPKQLQRRSA